MHLAYGASLRSLFAFANTPDIYHALVLSETKGLSTDGLANLLLFPGTTADDCHYLTSTGPLSADRTELDRKVASQYIFGECCRQILRDGVKQLRRFYDMLRNEPRTAASAGMIFEHRAHQFLREGRVIDLLPLFANASPEGGSYVVKGYRDSNPVQFTLPKMGEHVVDEKTEHTHELSTYYRPQSADFPSIDSWILIRYDPQDGSSSLCFR